MFGTYSSFFLWVCTSFYTFARAAISPSLEGVASYRKVIVQLCLNSWMSLKPLGLSKQHTLFLVVHSGWSCAKPCQYPKGKDLSQHLDSGWLEVRLSGSTCKVCKFHRKMGDGHFCLLTVHWSLGNSQLRTVSLFGTISLNGRTQAPLSTRAGYQGMCFLGNNHRKSVRQTCTQLFA